LHDTGKLILASNFSSQYAEAVGLARQNRGPLFTAEREVFGITHADVGGYLLGLWGLPVPVVEAIALHHSPRVSAGKMFTALTAVHAADVLVQERRSSIEDIAPPRFDAPYLNELGLEEHLERWRSTVNESPPAGEVI
jgi:HD-like signal output (HDOD) protein